MSLIPDNRGVTNDDIYCTDNRGDACRYEKETADKKLVCSLFLTKRGKPTTLKLGFSIQSLRCKQCREHLQGSMIDVPDTEPVKGK